MSEERAASAVARLWGDAAAGRRVPDAPIHWLGSPLVLRHCVNPRISGEPDTGWLQWIRREFVPETRERGFVLGCGGGELERRAAALGMCRRFHAVDIAPEAVRVASALAAREGLDFHYEVRDANTLELSPSSLDLAMADMALHHVEKLEHALDQIARALRPGGLLILNEFVGPDRFQWTDDQLRLATACIRSLPLRLRRNRDLARWKRIVKPFVWRAKRWSAERVARMDPSESVRSSEIPRLVSERFEIVRRIDYGGSLLALVLNNIVGNFEDRPEDVARLRDLAESEERWMKSGLLRSDHALIVARPR